MKTRFLEYIGDNQLIGEGQKVLLAVSGGIDSMVLFDLFVKAGFGFAVAHCNFRLRGDESDGDEKFVAETVGNHQKKLHTQNFETADYARMNGISVEMAARELRYSYFDELCQKHGYDLVATAHHQDDLIETFFLNLARKTGIKGLTGIKPKSGRLIRPLLFANRDEIQNYANLNDINFREDSSNDTTVYKRNFIRHNILPRFDEMNPAFRENVLAGIRHLKEVEEVYNYSMEAEKKKVFIVENNAPSIDIRNLKKTPFPKTLLYGILSEFRFNPAVIDEIFAGLDDDSGKQFFSPAYRVVKDREKLIITEIKEKSQAVYYVEEGDIELFAPLNLELSRFGEQGFSIPDDPKTACLDFEKLSFPLVLKKWQPGEYFRPLGLKGFKKLSDFFIDEKLSIPEKEDAWILYSEGKVAWVVGFRIDDRFKITPETRKVYQLKIRGT